MPEGDGPLVVVAPSTSQDPECELLRVALDALAEEPVRVLATTNRHRPERPIEVPANAKLVEWMLYSQAMPAADVVICHGGPRDGGEGTGRGGAAAGLPRGRGHGRERGAGGVVRDGAVGAAAAAVAAGRSGWRRGGCSARSGSGRGPVAAGGRP